MVLLLARAMGGVEGEDIEALLTGLLDIGARAARSVLERELGPGLLHTWFTFLPVPVRAQAPSPPLQVRPLQAAPPSWRPHWLQPQQGAAGPHLAFPSVWPEHCSDRTEHVEGQCYLGEASLPVPAGPLVAREDLGQGQESQGQTEESGLQCSDPSRCHSTTGQNKPVSFSQKGNLYNQALVHRDCNHLPKPVSAETPGGDLQPGQQVRPGARHPHPQLEGEASELLLRLRLQI